MNAAKQQEKETRNTINKFYKIILGVVSAFGIVGADAQIIDQNQPINTGDIAGFYETDLAQSFKQTAGDIDGAGIYLYPEGTGGGQITISLYDALPNQGGSLLTSGTFSNPQPGNWVDVFWNDLAITPNTTYYLVFTSNQDDTLRIAGSSSLSYPNGQAYANPGYNPYNDDYAFRTYHEVLAPEPSTLALVGIGAAALLGFCRRK